MNRAAEDGKEHSGQKLNSFASVLLCFKISSSIFIQNISLLIFLCAVFKVSAQQDSCVSRHDPLFISLIL